jgi:hypothetical protein
MSCRAHRLAVRDDMNTATTKASVLWFAEEVSSQSTMVVIVREASSTPGPSTRCAALAMVRHHCSSPLTAAAVPHSSDPNRHQK